MGRTLKVLVIDDDPAVRETLCENLEEFGLEVTGATDGQQGLDLINEGYLPDIVVTDIIMPRKEGLEVIIHLRKTYPEVKVIAISGGGRTEAADFLELAKKFGADAIIPKPIDIDALGRTLKNLSCL